jgi:hypothetical protein
MHAANAMYLCTLLVLFKGSDFGQLTPVRFSLLVSSSFRSDVMLHVAFFIRVVFLAVLVFLLSVPADLTTVVYLSRTRSLVGANRQPVQFTLPSNQQSADPLLVHSTVGDHRQPHLCPLLSFQNFDDSSRSPVSPIILKVPAVLTTALNPSRIKSIVVEESDILPPITVVVAASEKPRLVQFFYELAPNPERGHALLCSFSSWKLFVSDYSLRREFNVSDYNLCSFSWETIEQWQRRNVSIFQTSVSVRKVVVWGVTSITSIQEVHHFEARHLPVLHTRSIDCLDVATVMWWQDCKPLFVASKNRCLVQVWTSNNLIDSNIPGRSGRLGRTYEVHCYIIQQSKIDNDSDWLIFIAAHRSSHCQSQYHQLVYSMHKFHPRTQNREQ